MNEDVPDFPAFVVTATLTPAPITIGELSAAAIVADVVVDFNEFVLYDVEVMTVWHGFCETIVVIVVVTTVPGRTDVAIPICELLLFVILLLLLFCAESTITWHKHFFDNFFFIIYKILEHFSYANCDTFSNEKKVWDGNENKKKENYCQIVCVKEMKLDG